MAGYRHYGWARDARAQPQVPLHPGPDPEHATPTTGPELEAGTPTWVASTPAPTLPDSLAGDLGGGPIGGGGPLDLTPADPQLGIAGGNGLTMAEAQELRGAAHAQDFGAVAAHAYHPTTDRFDGTGPHLAIIPDTPGDGDSPATLQYERTGVGQPNDPYARTGQRQKRWWDRYIDMHRWGVEYRPAMVRNAYTAPPQPPVAGGGPLDSPYPTAATADLGTPDSFVGPQARTTPGAWFTPDTPVDAATGLPAWGL